MDFTGTHYEQSLGHLLLLWSIHLKTWQHLKFRKIVFLLCNSRNAHVWWLHIWLTATISLHHYADCRLCLKDSVPILTSLLMCNGNCQSYQFSHRRRSMRRGHSRARNNKNTRTVHPKIRGWLVADHYIVWILSVFQGLLCCKESRSFFCFMFVWWVFCGLWALVYARSGDILGMSYQSLSFWFIGMALINMLNLNETGSERGWIISIERQKKTDIW